MPGWTGHRPEEQGRPYAAASAHELDGMRPWLSHEAEPAAAHDLEMPMLAGGEGYDWYQVPNLDVFLTRLYRFWAGKGLGAMVLSGTLNLLALAFTITFTAFLLLAVNWSAVLSAPCVAEDSCDISSVALYPNPLSSRGMVADVLVLCYVIIFGAYWAWSAAHLASDVRNMLQVQHFVRNKLGISARSVAMITWAEMLHKVVVLQRTTRLCAARDLDEHDMVSRIMRTDNYLIAFINKGVLQLTPPSTSQVAAAAVGGVLRGLLLLLAQALHGLAALLSMAGTPAAPPQYAPCPGKEALPHGGAHLLRDEDAGRPGQLLQAGGAVTAKHVPLQHARHPPPPHVLQAHLEQLQPTHTAQQLAGLQTFNEAALPQTLPLQPLGGQSSPSPQAAHPHPHPSVGPLQGGGAGGVVPGHQGSVAQQQGRGHLEVCRHGHDRGRAFSLASGLRRVSRQLAAWAHGRAASSARPAPSSHARLAARAAQASAPWRAGHHTQPDGSWPAPAGQQSRALPPRTPAGPVPATRGWWKGTGEVLGQQPGAALLKGRQPLLTKTLEWNLRWFVLDHMFDEHFRVRPEFVQQPERLKRRLKAAALLNAVLSPFLLLFLLLYFFLRNAERFYHHPGSAGSRRWSALARWRLREFNELPHYCTHRLDCAHAPACRYVSQFPSFSMASLARFVAFITGSFTALLLLLTLLDEKLLERPLLGRHLVWWLATLGVVLTACRAFIDEEPVGYDPERAMQEVVYHTHYLPRHWRGKAHTAEVQAAFNTLFQFKVLLFLEELASVVLTPFMLYFTLPACADDITQFVADFTVYVEGVGDVCSFAAFDLRAHGNVKYGAPETLGGPLPKAARTRQGKLEKSLLTFVATYPTWEPSLPGKAMLAKLGRVPLNQSHWSLPHEAPPLGSAWPLAVPQGGSTHMPWDTPGRRATGGTPGTSSFLLGSTFQAAPGALPPQHAPPSAPHPPPPDAAGASQGWPPSPPPDVPARGGHPAHRPCAAAGSPTLTPQRDCTGRQADAGVPLPGLQPQALLAASQQGLPLGASHHLPGAASGLWPHAPPVNETAALSQRLVQGHGLLQDLYEQSDLTVLHRRIAATAGGLSAHQHVPGGSFLCAHSPWGPAPPPWAQSSVHWEQPQARAWFGQPGADHEATASLQHRVEPHDLLQAPTPQQVAPPPYASPPLPPQGGTPMSAWPQAGGPSSAVGPQPSQHRMHTSTNLEVGLGRGGDGGGVMYPDQFAGTTPSTGGASQAARAQVAGQPDTEWGHAHATHTPDVVHVVSGLPTYVGSAGAALQVGGKAQHLDLL